MKRKRGYTLAELMVVVLVLGTLAGLLLPAAVKAARRSRVSACAVNLSQLWKLENIYMSRWGSRGSRMPRQTGKAFWLWLTTGSPPLIDASVWDIYCCPVRRESALGRVDYLGPPSDVMRLANDAPVGSDEPEAHFEGGNVLLKSGDVVEFDPAAWRALHLDQRCIP